MDRRVWEGWLDVFSGMADLFPKLSVHAEEFLKWGIEALCCRCPLSVLFVGEWLPMAPFETPVCFTFFTQFARGALPVRDEPASVSLSRKV